MPPLCIKVIIRACASISAYRDFLDKLTDLIKIGLLKKLVIRFIKGLCIAGVCEEVFCYSREFLFGRAIILLFLILLNRRDHLARGCPSIGHTFYA